MTLKKGQIITLDIANMAVGGKGIARVEGLVVSAASGVVSRTAWVGASAAAWAVGWKRLCRDLDQS